MKKLIVLSACIILTACNTRECSQSDLAVTASSVHAAVASNASDAAASIKTCAQAIQDLDEDKIDDDCEYLSHKQQRDAAKLASNNPQNIQYIAPYKRYRD